MDRSNNFFRACLRTPKMVSYEEVVTCLRSCLVSVKGKCEIRHLRNDYKAILGTDVPFRQLGYNTVEDLIKSIPTLMVTKGPNGQFFVDAKPDERSAHISELVNKQKSSKKASFRAPLRPRYTRSNSFQTHMKSTPKWKPTYLGNKKPQYKTSSLPAAVSHTQFVRTPNKDSPSPRQEQPPQRKVSPPAQSRQNLFQRRVTMMQHKDDTVKQQQQKEEAKQQRRREEEVKVREARKENDVPVRFIRTINEKPEMNYNGPTQSMAKLVQKKTVQFDFKNTTPQLNITPQLTMASQPISPPALSPEVPPFVPTKKETWNFGIAPSVATNNKETFQKTGDSLIDIFTFVQYKSLPEPIFKTISRQTKPHRPVFYDCQLKIGEHSFSSYPKDCTDEISAKQEAARLALEELIPLMEKKQELLVSTPEDILERIPPIVEKHYHGVWDWQLEEDYKDMFSEQLPSNWLDIVNMSSSLSVERCLNDKFVLRFCQPGEILQKGKNSHQQPLAFEVSIPCNTVTFNENRTLLAEVTCVVSAKEIWCRQLDTRQAEDFLEMSLFLDNRVSSPYRMNGDALRAKDINIGGYYIAKYYDSYIRVRILELVDNDMVNCFQVDFGDDCVLPKNVIFNMKREFAREQAQAFICRLAGLEDLYEVTEDSDALQRLVGMQVQLESAIDENFEFDPTDGVLPVIMYSIDNKECLNKELISVLTIESATPNLTQGINEVVVTHVESNGDVYIQIPSPGLEKLTSLLKELEESFANNAPVCYISDSKHIDTEKLYFLRDKEADSWHRIKVLDSSPCGVYSQILYVDLGRNTVIQLHKEQVIPLDEISDIISQFPPQALRVRMYIDEIPENFVSICSGILCDGQSVLLKIAKYDERDSLAHVEFYKRSQPDGILYPINKTIAVQNELKMSGAGDGNNNKLSMKMEKLKSLNQFDESNKNVPSSGSLQAPVIEPVGQYFDVIVPHAVNPWNFFVQPYKQNKELCELQKRLQEKYSKTDSYSPLRVEDILPGKIYASKHKDGKWYRTSVMKVIGPSSISVCYCDFGYYSSLTVQQLLPLGPQFTSLPYQAIKAKLHGVKPCRDKWSVEDCEYFQKLVTHKLFVSIIVKIEKDELYKLDTVLSLKLIDTSTDKDINIEQHMVDIKKASSI